MRHIFCRMGFLALGLCVLGSQMTWGQALRPGVPWIGNLNGRTFILAANGSETTSGMLDNLAAALSDAGIGRAVCIKNIGWTRHISGPDNHRDVDSHLLGGARMAFQAMQIRRAYPLSPIVLIGFDAGTHVVLAAADQLPPGSVDRIILLTPTVGACYDLRPALRTSKFGINSFNNTLDPLVDVNVDRWGSADCQPPPVATTVGFKMHKRGPASGDPIFARLWQCNVPGNHNCTIQPCFLEERVIPLIPIVRDVPPGAPLPIPPQMPFASLGAAPTPGVSPLLDTVSPGNPYPSPVSTTSPASEGSLPPPTP